MSTVVSSSGPVRDPSARRGAYVNLAVVAAVLAIVIPIALHAAQPPPPSVAEFAPEAKQIKQPPKELAGLVGKRGGEGAAPFGGIAPSPSPPPPINTLSVHHCVGDPPRQIEDPQSPPCVPYWQGDNGGATSKGVDGSTIKVFAWDINWGDKSKYAWQKALEDFVNERFEFYGRKVKITFNWEAPGTPVCNQDTPDVALQNAARVIAMGVFASTEYCTAEGSEVPYYTALAQHGILSSIGDPVRQGEADLYSKYDPYIWNAVPGLDTIERNMADWTCRGLEGKVARWAGDPTYTRTIRKFGLVYMDDLGQDPEYQLLLDLLAACGHPIAQGDVIQIDAGTRTNPPDSTKVAKLKADGVTTVICLCDNGYSGTFQDAAHSAGYLPEWFYSTYYQGESEVHSETFWPPDEARHAFGMSFINKLLPIQQRPWYWGCKETRPNDACAEGVTDSPQAWYSSLLDLVSGIQMAGPHLTPYSFRDSLFNTQFPDPDNGQAPYYQAAVSFGPDHSFFDDATLIWWSSSDVSVEVGRPGAWCYANHGQRYRLGEWPATDNMLFTGTCR